MIIFLILDFQKKYSKWNKFKIIIKTNPTHLIKIEQQNCIKKTTKIQKNNVKIITITTKIQHNYF